MNIGHAMKASIRKPGTILVIILLIGLFVRLWEMTHITAIELDGSLYARMGELWAQGAFKEALGGLFPPVFPCLIGVFHLVIPDIELAGRMVSLAAGMLLIFVTFLFLKRFHGERAALFGSAFIAFHPYLVRNSTMVLTEATATLLFASALFFFYASLQDDTTRHACYSAVLLGFTYLARPEFIVYCAPLAIFLLIRKKYTRTVLFLACFLCFAGSYMLYLKMETGLFVVSQKAILAKNQPDVGAHVRSYLLPFLPFQALIRNIPYVVLHFFEALFIPICLLMVFGFKKIAASYRNLMIAAVLFHVFSLATMTPSSRRLSEEFIPLMIPFAVEGFFVIERFWGRFRHKNILRYGTIGIIIAACLSQAFTSPDSGRLLHKRVGLYLLSFDPGHPVISRLPIIAFYSKGEWVHIIPLMQKKGNCGKLPEIAAHGKAKYFAVDDVMEKKLPFLKHCVMGLPLVLEVRDGEDFIKLYRVDHG